MKGDAPAERDPLAESSSTASSAGSRGTTLPLGDRWNLSDLYGDDVSFRAAMKRARDRLPGLARFRGRAGESPASLAEALDENQAILTELRRLQAYASMKSDSDTRVATAQAARQEADMLFAERASETAFLVPEIAALPPERIDAFLCTEPALLPHAHFLRDVLRQRRHILLEAEEKILAEAGALVSGPSSVFGILHNAELPRPEVALASGETVRLTPAAFAFHRASPRREDRRKVAEAYFGASADFTGTLGQNLFECVKAHRFRARVRGYGSCAEAALDADNIPLSVYRKLIERVRGLLPLLHRYFRLRARALGVETLRYYDLHCPLVPGPRASFDTARARCLVREALSPLGPSYAGVLERAFAERWIDWHPAPGKRSGAYATGSAHDVHPYVLLNFNGDYESVSTLAHEMGHAVHSHFSNLAQPPSCAEYSTFVAEVASTFNEILLGRSMLRAARTRDEKLFLVGGWLDGIRATLFRQAMFAEFELAIHDVAERNEALTGESLSALYLKLAREYHGHEKGVVEIEDRYAVEWATVPHFYYDFYVYQYATGIIAAIRLAEAVLADEPDARERYLEFLASGGSDYPLEILRKAGVDFEDSEPFEAAARKLRSNLETLEGLIESTV